MLRRQQADGLRSDRQSDPIACFGLNGVRRIHVHQFAGYAADDQALTVTDKTDAVNDAAERMSGLFCVRVSDVRHSA
jgi:hypothetical protein